MARGRSKASAYNSVIANQWLLDWTLGFKPMSSVSPLTLIEDRRTFHPEGPFRPARGLFAPRHFLQLHQPNANKRSSARTKLPSLVGFQDPRRVLVCVRRKMRREVMFALDRTRKGSGGAKRKSYYSDVVC